MPINNSFILKLFGNFIYVLNIVALFFYLYGITGSLKLMFFMCVRVGVRVYVRGGGEEVINFTMVSMAYRHRPYLSLFRRIKMMMTMKVKYFHNHLLYDRYYPPRYDDFSS